MTEAQPRGVNEGLDMLQATSSRSEERCVGKLKRTLQGPNELLMQEKQEAA